MCEYLNKMPYGYTILWNSQLECSLPQSGSIDDQIHLFYFFSVQSLLTLEVDSQDYGDEYKENRKQTKLWELKLLIVLCDGDRIKTASCQQLIN